MAADNQKKIVDMTIDEAKEYIRSGVSKADRNTRMEEYFIPCRAAIERQINKKNEALNMLQRASLAADLMVLRNEQLKLAFADVELQHEIAQLPEDTDGAAKAA